MYCQPDKNNIPGWFIIEKLERPNLSAYRIPASAYYRAGYPDNVTNRPIKLTKRRIVSSISSSLSAVKPKAAWVDRGPWCIVVSFAIPKDRRHYQRRRNRNY